MCVCVCGRGALALGDEQTEAKDFACVGMYMYLLGERVCWCVDECVCMGGGAPIWWHSATSRLKQRTVLALVDIDWESVCVGVLVCVCVCVWEGGLGTRRRAD